MTACASEPTPSAPPATQRGDAVPTGADRGGSVARGTTDASTRAAIEAAVLADAAELWNVTDASRLRLRSDAVTWSDGSIGCPRPGVMYTQALVPGWRLVVSDGPRELLYHASRGGYWLQCPPGRARPPLAGSATY